MRFLKVALVPTIIALFAAVLLAVVNMLLIKDIEANKRVFQEKAIKMVLAEDACTKKKVDPENIPSCVVQQEKKLVSAYKLVPKMRKLGKFLKPIYYTVKDSSNNIIAYAYVVYGKELKIKGFGGPIDAVVVFNPNLTKIIGIGIVDDRETPGFGSKAHDYEFRKYFQGLPTDVKIDYVKGEKPNKSKGEIRAITGATITTKAIVDLVNKAIKEAKKIIAKGNLSYGW